MSLWAAAVLAGAILLLILLELRDPAFANSWRQDPLRLRRNLSYAAASVTVMALLPWLSGWIHATVPPLVDWRGAWLLEGICCFLAAELLGWLLHFVKHHNSFLWSFHFQHHREEHFNLWLTAHSHALEVATSATVIAIITGLLGFSNRVIELYLVIYSFAKVYQHSAQGYTLGPLDKVLIGPAYHRLHHEADSRCNYGITTPAFDLLFGTASWPGKADQQATSRYGIEGADQMPFGFWSEMTHFLRRNGPKPTLERNPQED